MNTSSRCHLLRTWFICLVAALGLRSLHGAESLPTDMVISHGVIAGLTANGQPVPATLRNIADEIMRHFSRANINIVGVDNVVIDDLRLRWPTTPGTDDATWAVLTVLVEATHHQKFFVVHPGANQFVLTSPEGRPEAQRSIAVFNVGSYVDRVNELRPLENERRDLEMALGLANIQKPADEKGIANLKNRIAALSDGEKRLKPTKEEVSHRLDQITEVVNSTLQKLSPGEPAPEFEYHPGTHLLIVLGNQRAIEVAQKVVSALQSSPE